MTTQETITLILGRIASRIDVRRAIYVITQDKDLEKELLPLEEHLNRETKKFGPNPNAFSDIEYWKVIETLRQEIKAIIDASNSIDLRVFLRELYCELDKQEIMEELQFNQEED